MLSEINAVLDTRFIALPDQRYDLRNDPDLGAGPDFFWSKYSAGWHPAAAPNASAVFYSTEKPRLGCSIGFRISRPCGSLRFGDLLPVVPRPAIGHRRRRPRGRLSIQVVRRLYIKVMLRFTMEPSYALIHPARCSTFQAVYAHVYSKCAGRVVRLIQGYIACGP